MKAYSLILALALMTSTAFAQDVSQSIDGLRNSRTEVESNVARTPYQKSQQDVFKQYFTGLNDFVAEIKGSEYLFDEFNSYVLRTGVAAFCKSVLLDNVRWKELVKNCTKNRFFLCAEEIKSFQAAKAGLRDLLYQDLKNEFSRSNNCNN